MTADLAAAAEKVRAEPELEASKPKAKWTVVKQIHLGGEIAECPACYHRFELVAEWCARRWTNRHAAGDGAYFSARKAES